MTTTPPITDDTSDGVTRAEEWLIGDYYQHTAHLPLNQVADSVKQDLYDVRFDRLLPAHAEFEVTVDSHGPVPVLRVTISGLMGADDPVATGHEEGDYAAVYQAIRQAYGDTAVVYEVMRRVFGLVNHYNRVRLTRPDQSRFIQHVAALRPDGTPAIVLIGMMHDGTSPGLPTPDAGMSLVSPPATDAIVEPSGADPDFPV